jgi:predicted nucleic acid-binding protein
MDKPTLYMETSIPSYMLADPSRDPLVVTRQEATRAWWHRDHARFEVFVSDAVLDEAERGDRSAAKRRRDFLERFPVLPDSPEVQRLTELYFRERIVPSQKAADAAHLAFASVYRIEFLCTWNFKHLANAFALRRLRALNEKRGLFTPYVCTPDELLGG